MSDVGVTCRAALVHPLAGTTYLNFSGAISGSTTLRS